MNILLAIILFTTLGGILSVIAAGAFLLLPEKQQDSVLPHGISFAIGALLAAAFWGLIPHAFEDIAPSQFQNLSGTILMGLLSFFILEKFLIWRHCHYNHCDAHNEGHESSEVKDHQAAGILILIGDGIHNFVDGILIAAAFLTDIQLGIVTSLAVAAHEIPQEVGDFAILLQSGYSKKKSFIYNIISSIGTVVGGVLAYFFLEDLHDSLPYFLALAASSFIYIAVADLIPSLHKKTDMKTSLQQIGLIAMGILLISGMHNLAFIAENH